MEPFVWAQRQSQGTAQVMRRFVPQAIHPRLAPEQVGNPGIVRALRDGEAEQCQIVGARPERGTQVADLDAGGHHHHLRAKRHELFMHGAVPAVPMPGMDPVGGGEAQRGLDIAPRPLHPAAGTRGPTRPCPFETLPPGGCAQRRCLALRPASRTLVAAGPVYAASATVKRTRRSTTRWAPVSRSCRPCSSTATRCSVVPIRDLQRTRHSSKRAA